MIYEKLGAIQQALKAPKDLENTFGGYKYRSAESILEAVKPLLSENKCVLLLRDALESIEGRVSSAPGDSKYARQMLAAYNRKSQNRLPDLL